MEASQALQVVDGLMRTESELDAYNVEQRARARAEALQPLPPLVDLFGNPVDRISRRKMKSRRNEVKAFARRVLEFGVTPQDVLYREMLRAVERDERDKAVEIAAILLPYSLPRLAAIGVAMPPTGSGAGRVAFTWEESRAIASGTDHDSLRAEVVSAADP